jgi:hypothetical protein
VAVVFALRRQAAVAAFMERGCGRHACNVDSADGGETRAVDDRRDQ